MPERDVVISTHKKYVWPENSKFAVCLTHDVDEVRKTFQYITHFLKTARLYHLTSFFKNAEPYWNFERIMKIEEKYGVRSTFFFLNESKKLDLRHPRDCYLTFNSYSFYDQKITRIIRMLYNNGWEIGLHGSYESYKNKALMAKEKNDLECVLGTKIKGVRQHFLNLDVPSTWYMQRELGLQYDASLGFNDAVGYREEKLFPFRPFKGEFLVIPLTVMDYALFFQFKNTADAARKIKQIIDQAADQGALLTILWHQRVFNENEYPGWSKVYEDIIRMSKAKSAWIATAKDIAEWWTLSNY